MRTEEQYDAVVAKCQSLFEKKLQDYGSAWRVLRLSSLTDQILIKARRIRQLQESKQQKIQEGEATEFIGIVNYSVMALIQIEKGIVKRPDIDIKTAINLYKKQVGIVKKLMLMKNYDYGEAWRAMRISSLTDLILQKLLRIKQIEDNQCNTLVSEGIDANYMDIINYAVFAVIHMEEGLKK